MHILPLSDYDVFIGDCRPELKKFLDRHSYSQIIVTVDEHTREHCLPYLKDSLGNQKLTVIRIPAGELHKNLETCQLIWQEMLKAAADRKALAINLGGALILERKWNRAEAILRQATTANPHNIMLWTNLAAAHLGNWETAGPKQQERAIAAYEKALALDPQAPNIHYHLGLIYKERRDWRNAIAYFEQALAVAPNDRDARRWLDQINAIRADEADSEQP